MVLEFFTRYFKGLLLLIVLAFILLSSLNIESSPPPNLAKLYLNFPILDSSGFREQVEKIKQNPSIKGVLLIVNSPGGGVGASIEIADLIKDLNRDLPVVAYVESLMASGAYYAGIYAHSIYANRGALVGSIGVIFSGYNIEELLNSLGIKSQGTKAGIYKEAGTMTRQWTREELDLINHLTQQNYELFYTDVIEARGNRLKYSNPRIFAEGRVFTATEALDIGLIDGVSSMSAAIESLKELAGVSEEIWLKKEGLQSFLENLTQSTISHLASLAAPQMQAIWGRP